jgi:tetratricopeptide (TPR) repeat protein
MATGHSMKGHTRSVDGVAHTLARAVEFHRAGNLNEAERLYRKVLKASPRHGDALNLLGVVMLARGNAGEALKLFEAASQALPHFFDAAFNLANALTALGRRTEAISALRRAIGLQGTRADAFLNLGALLVEDGQTEGGLHAFREATRLAPRDPRGYLNLAVTLARDIRGKRGDESLRPAITETLSTFAHLAALDPANPDVRFAYANFLADRSLHAAAVEQFEAALRMRPAWPEALSNMADALEALGRVEEAVAASARAVALRPTDSDLRFRLATRQVAAKHPDGETLLRDLVQADPSNAALLINLGNAHKDREDPERAIACFEDALHLSPQLSEGYSNLGAAFADKGCLAIASILHDKAVTLRTDVPASAKFNRALAALSVGRLREGWEAFDERFESAKEKIVRRETPPPYWNGEPLEGKSILLWTEQGIGDEILMASMLPEVLRVARHCVIECSQRLVPVFARSFPSAEVRGYENAAIPTFDGSGLDYQLAAASLGRFFRTEFAAFPAHNGYLRADSDRTTEFRARYDGLAAGRRIVGLSWRSKNDRIGQYKSARLIDLASILQRRDCFFVDLQYGNTDTERAQVKEALGIDVYRDPEIDALLDMDAFFAQVAALDLVITSSNTSAHVAGSQNVPVWILLPRVRGTLWYWFTKRQDSPWYPSARLFRQGGAAPNWAEEVAQLAATGLSAFPAGPRKS